MFQPLPPAAFAYLAALEAFCKNISKPSSSGPAKNGKNAPEFYSFGEFEIFSPTKPIIVELFGES